MDARTQCVDAADAVLYNGLVKSKKKFDKSTYSLNIGAAFRKTFSFRDSDSPPQNGWVARRVFQGLANLLVGGIIFDLSTVL